MAYCGLTLSALSVLGLGKAVAELRQRIWDVNIQNDRANISLFLAQLLLLSGLSLDIFLYALQRNLFMLAQIGAPPIRETAGRHTTLHWKVELPVFSRIYHTCAVQMSVYTT